MNPNKSALPYILILAGSITISFVGGMIKGGYETRRGGTGRERGREIHSKELKSFFLNIEIAFGDSFGATNKIIGTKFGV